MGYQYKSELVLLPSTMSKEGEMKPFRLNSASYIRRCLAGVVPSLKRGNRIFQHDGARCHMSKDTQKYLKNKKVEMIPDWPPYSPDLSPIERVWKELNTRVGAMCPMTLDELIECALQAWDDIPQSVIDAHCLHLRKQCSKLG